MDTSVADDVMIGDSATPPTTLSLLFTSSSQYEERTETYTESISADVEEKGDVTREEEGDELQDESEDLAQIEEEKEEDLYIKDVSLFIRVWLIKHYKVVRCFEKGSRNNKRVFRCNFAV